MVYKVVNLPRVLAKQRLLDMAGIAKKMIYKVPLAKHVEIYLALGSLSLHTPDFAEIVRLVTQCVMDRIPGVACIETRFPLVERRLITNNFIAGSQGRCSPLIAEIMRAKYRR